jgi:hypothetical protein
MLIFSVLLASAIQQPMVANSHCTRTAIRSVNRDTDKAAPTVLTTTSEKRYRLLGTDFIHARRDWKAGEKLRLCLNPKDHTTAITNLRRHEDVVGLPAEAH